MEREGKGGEGRGEEAYTGNVAEETLCLKSAPVRYDVTFVVYFTA